MVGTINGQKITRIVLKAKSCSCPLFKLSPPDQCTCYIVALRTMPGDGKLVLQLMSSIIKTRPMHRLYQNVLLLSLSRCHNCSHNLPFSFPLRTFLRNNDIWGGRGVMTNLTGGVGWRRRHWAAAWQRQRRGEIKWMLCYLNYDVGRGGHLSRRPNCSCRFPSVWFLF